MTTIIRLSFSIATALVLAGCPRQEGPDIPGPPPLDPTGTEYCAEMCDVIGPDGLQCEEGEPVYNNDLPGPEGEPNQSCTEWCEEQQDRGFYINPKCVRLVESCEEIEDARQKEEADCPDPV